MYRIVQTLASRVLLSISAGGYTGSYYCFFFGTFDGYRIKKVLFPKPKKVFQGLFPLLVEFSFPKCNLFLTSYDVVC